MECKRYFQRFSFVNRHEYLEGIIHTKYNEHDAMIKPLMEWLDSKGVKIAYGCSVYDLTMDTECNTVQSILLRQNETEQKIKVGADDLVFVTNGSMVTNSAFGDNNTVAPTNRDTTDLGVFTLWQNLAKKNEKFGHPEKLLGQIDKMKWVSFFPTIKDYHEFVKRLERMTGSPAGTGGCVTIKDSAWDISIVLHHKPFFIRQAEDEEVLWGYGLYGENVGNYVKKPMCDCTGEEIMTELLYYLNMLDLREELLVHTYVSTCMMPYITTQFMPRKVKDRPKNVPDGCTNLGFIGQYVEVADDVVFTVEMSVRTGMEAVYKLTGLERDVLEVYPSRFDVRYIAERLKKFSGIKGEVTVDDLPNINPLKMNELKHKVVDMVNDIPPYYKMYLGRDQTIPMKASILHPEAPYSK